MLQTPAYDAATLLREATVRHNIHLGVLVAETGLWAHPDVHRYLVRENTTGAFFPHIRRYRAGQGEKPTQQIGNLYLDNNSYANNAIKRALGISRESLIGFEACHIWPRTCYDERYHTAIANLVLLPRALAGLSDHDTEIERVLQYRAYELYDGWYPKDREAPTKPDVYPTFWREPLPFTRVLSSALARRRLREQPVVSEDMSAPS
jgi:hypothetical protein